VGTPAQRFDVVADTGSNAVIVTSCLCEKGGTCDSKGKCFTGTNRSSSFSLSLHNVSGKSLPPFVKITFGSGTIEAAIATDVVSVGNHSAQMDESLLLMLARALRVSGPFEGILGLGLPRSQIGGKHSKKYSVLTDIDTSFESEITPKKHSSHLVHKPTPGFMEKAKLPRFSVCLNDGSDGVLRLAQPPVQNLLGSIGKAHWALEFGGISVGQESHPSPFCSRDSMRSGQSTPCAAIPDSGTTVMKAPKKHIRSLFAELCRRWPRCQQQANSTAIQKSNLSSEVKLSVVFQKVLLGCNDWMNASHGLDQELPPLHFHLAGANGEKQTIKLAGAGYVVETMRTEVHYVTKILGGIFPIRFPVDMGKKKKICTPAFGTMGYNTSKNGPVWILGLPIFYQYRVGYELTSDPPAMSFSEEPCGSCGPSGLADNKTDSISLMAAKRSGSVRQPRLLRGPRRLPTIDVNEPL